MSTTTWLDIGVVRIQRYLGRTNTLLGHRAGSGLVADALRSDDLLTAARLDGVEVTSHDQAGDTDGVAHLRFSAAVDDETARACARYILQHLRRTLPAAQFEASWADGTSYQAAFPAGTRSTESTERWIPAVNAVPFARRCDTTGTDVAVTTRRHHEASLRLGRDAARRFAHEYDRPGAGPTRGAMRRLTRFDGRELPRDLTAVAKTLEHHDDKTIRRTANHLATVFIDGNAMGAFFNRVAAEAPDQRQELSAATKTAMIDAVGEALAALDERIGHGPDQPMPFEVHVLGGDDVLLSVPAVFGIAVALDIIGRFGSAMHETVTRIAPTLADSAPTASAGIVIAHRNTPISGVIELADELLARAKRGGNGSATTLSWTDVTRYGDSVDDRPVFRHDDLTEARPEVEQLQGLGNAARNIVLGAARHDNLVLARAGARVELARRRRPDLIEHAEDPKRLAELLDISRWWF